MQKYSKGHKMMIFFLMIKGAMVGKNMQKKFKRVQSMQNCAKVGRSPPIKGHQIK